MASVWSGVAPPPITDLPGDDLRPARRDRCQQCLRPIDGSPPASRDHAPAPGSSSHRSNSNCRRVVSSARLISLSTRSARKSGLRRRRMTTSAFSSENARLRSPSSLSPLTRDQVRARLQAVRRQRLVDPVTPAGPSCTRCRDPRTLGPPLPPERRQFPHLRSRREPLHPEVARVHPQQQARPLR